MNNNTSTSTASTDTRIKYRDNSHLTVHDLLKDYPIKPFVYRTTMKPVAKGIGQFAFVSSKTPAPAYFNGAAFTDRLESKREEYLRIMEYYKGLVIRERIQRRNRAGLLNPFRQ